MPGQLLSTEALVLGKRPPEDAHQAFDLFSSEHGVLHGYQRLSKKSPVAGLDLFDEAAFTLESSNQGKTWFVRESRLLLRHERLGRSYETLQCASRLARLVLRNNVPEEGRQKIFCLLREAFSALADSDRPDIVHLKCLFRIARDEGYPLREDWMPSLPRADRELLTDVLATPVRDLKTEPDFISKITVRLEAYLRSETEILMD